MELHNLQPAVGSNKKNKRVGRGTGSGYGGTSTRGHKGAKSRSGYKRKIGFEGGQIPLYRRLPKRGFKNHFAVNYAIVNVAALNEFEDGAVVDEAVLLERRLITDPMDGLKILGNGELTKKLTVKANRFTASAKEKIEAVGGKAEVE